jgi:hypothetical protein
MPMSQTPAAMSLATSRSPPDGFLARFAFRPSSQACVCLLSVVGEVGGEQRVVVDVLAGADADPAAPLRIGEVLVGQLVDV